MKNSYRSPVLRNQSKPYVGDDTAYISTDELGKRVGRNTGNLAFLFALMKQIKAIRHSSDAGSAQGDVSVLGCSNWIHARRERPDYIAMLRNTEGPFVAIGLGAQANTGESEFDIPPTTLEFLRLLAKRAPSDAPNISVRGEYTYQVLKRAGLQDSAIVLGCPSLFLNPDPKLGESIARTLATRPERVASAPGDLLARSNKHDTIERSLAEIAHAYGGGYVIQHPMSVIGLLRDSWSEVDSNVVNVVGQRLWPGLASEELRKWIRSNGRVFSSVPMWLEYLRTVDFMIAARIHGCALAIQAGRPGLCIALDERQIELCESMELPYLDADSCTKGVSMERAYDVVRQHDWVKFDENRRKLATKYEWFLRQNGLRPAKCLQRLCVA